MMITRYNRLDYQPLFGNKDRTRESSGNRAYHYNEYSHFPSPLALNMSGFHYTLLCRLVMRIRKIIINTVSSVLCQVIHTFISEC